MQGGETGGWGRGKTHLCCQGEHLLHQLLRVGGALQKQLDNGRQQLQLHLRTSEVGYLTVVGYFSCLTVVGCLILMG